MKVLYCTPGLEINSDAPWATRQRAGGMLAAGLEVVLMVSLPEERRYFEDMGCEIIVDELSGDTAENRRDLPNNQSLQGPDVEHVCDVVCKALPDASGTV